MFGRPVNLTFKGGRRYNESILGAILTILMLLLVVGFATYKGLVMNAHAESRTSMQI